MVELLFWICFFLLGLDIKNEKDVYLMTAWIVLVIRFRVFSRLMLSWMVSDVLENFFRFFLDHKLFTSCRNKFSPPMLSSGYFSLQKRLSYPFYIKDLDRFGNVQLYGLIRAEHSGELRGGVRHLAAWLYFYFIKIQ